MWVRQRPIHYFYVSHASDWNLFKLVWCELSSILNESKPKSISHLFNSNGEIGRNLFDFFEMQIFRCFNTFNLRRTAWKYFSVKLDLHAIYTRRCKIDQELFQSEKYGKIVINLNRFDIARFVCWSIQFFFLAFENGVFCKCLLVFQIFFAQIFFIYFQTNI